MNHLRIAAGAALLAATLAPGLQAAPIGAVYVFGDSLNDCCRNPGAPFTNGPETWLPEFAAAVGGSYAETEAQNLAVGGAQTGPFNAVAQTDIDLGYLTGFTSQAERFRADAPAVGANDLGVLWVGTNDIWASAHDGDLLFGAVPFNRPIGRQPSVDAFVAYMMATLRAGIADLVAGGIESLLILTPYDMSQAALWDTPGAQALNAAYSLALADTMARLHTPGIDTWLVDMVDVLAAAQPDFTFPTGQQSCQALGNGVDCDDHVFYDFVHLSTAMNSRVAAAAAAQVQTAPPLAPIPLPSAGVLLLAGLGGLAALRRRAG